MGGSHHLDSGVIHNYFVVACLDKTSAQVFQLLPGLHEQVTAGRWELHRNAFPSIPSPYVKARVSRTTVDGQEVEIRVEASKDGIFFAVFYKIRSCRGQEVGAKYDCENEVGGQQYEQS